MQKLNDRDLFKIIGKNIKYYRILYSLNKEKITQEKLAEIVNVSPTLIGNIESDKVNSGISVPVLYKISKALDVSIDDLVTKRK